MTITKTINKVPSPKRHRKATRIKSVKTQEEYQEMLAQLIYEHEIDLSNYEGDEEIKNLLIEQLESQMESLHRIHLVQNGMLPENLSPCSFLETVDDRVKSLITE